MQRLGPQGLPFTLLGQGVLEGVADEQLRVQLSRLGERGFELLLSAAGDYCVRS